MFFCCFCLLDNASIVKAVSEHQLVYYLGITVLRSWFGISAVGFFSVGEDRLHS